MSEVAFRWLTESSKGLLWLENSIIYIFSKSQMIGKQW